RRPGAPPPPGRGARQRQGAEPQAARGRWGARPGPPGPGAAGRAGGSTAFFAPAGPGFLWGGPGGGGGWAAAGLARGGGGGGGQGGRRCLEPRQRARLGDRLREAPRRAERAVVGRRALRRGDRWPREEGRSEHLGRRCREGPRLADRPPEKGRRDAPEPN